MQVAAHSPQMDLIGDELLSALAGLQPRPGHTPIYSTTLGCLTDGAEFDAHYWLNNLRQPVLFHTALKSLLAEDRRIYIENLIPHPILLPAIDESGREVECRHTDARVDAARRARTGDNACGLGALVRARDSG